jgi:branched-chain amino acid transport system ATP-binding protein
MSSPLLSVVDLLAGYGQVTVLNRASFSVDDASRCALLGRNGAGKTTMLKAIMGLADIQAGQVIFDGHDITRLATHERALRGLGYVSQTRDIFPSLTVEENLIAGLKHKRRSDIESAYDLFPRLKQRRKNAGNQLSGGEQQMLSVARALLGNPRLLLLDEPLEGLAPVICQELLLAFERLGREKNIAVVIVEQQVYEVLAFVEQAAILERGTVQYAGPAKTLLEQHDILDRYVGMAVL